MKKTLSILLAALFVALVFAACDRTPAVSWKDSVNETFETVTECRYGKIISAEFGTVANVKIIDNSFEDFTKYIDDLKADGFEYYQIADIPESISESNGQSSWRGSKDGIYLFVIFSSDDSENFEAFGCNIQIFGYTEDPWVEKDEKDEKTTKADKSDKKTTEAEKTTKAD